MLNINDTKRIIAGIACICLCSTGVQAQFTYDYLKAADGYFKKSDYSSASEYYEKYLVADSRPEKTGSDPYAMTAPKKAVATSSKQQAVYQLAESYRLLTHYVKAEPLYKQALSFDQAQFPLAAYHYAVVLRAQSKYEEAEKAFNSFLNKYKHDDRYTEEAHREVQNLRFIREQLNRKDLRKYSFHKLAEGREGASYAPVWLGDSTLLFTATWPDGSGGKLHTNRIYQASYKNGTLTGVGKVSLPASDMQEGAAVVSEDGNTLYLTRWNVKNGKKAAAIFVSKKSASAGSNWSVPVLLDTLLNKPGYNVQQPYLLPGGKQLLYASDRPGGYGGYDLWVAELDNTGKPVSAANLGKDINTVFNEQAPYYHVPSGTLVFASDGGISMGGYDLFYSKGTIGQWAPPVNFGYPVNSVKDDMYFISRGTARNILEDVLMSSDRTAVCCLELMSLHKEKPFKQISGVVVSCDDQKPLAGVAVEIIDTIAHTTLYREITRTDGSYAFTLSEFQPLSAVTSLRGYVTASLPFHQPADVEADTLLNPPLCLVKEAPPVASVIVLENVYYEFNKADLKEASYPALEGMLTMLNKYPAMVIEVGGHTDDHGADELNRKLSEARAASVVAYLVSKGIASDRLIAKGYGASMPIAPNRNDDGSDNPEGREKNRRTEVKVIKN